jgi:hypothetical protein
MKVCNAVQDSGKNVISLNFIMDIYLTDKYKIR